MSESELMARIRASVEAATVRDDSGRAPPRMRPGGAMTEYKRAKDLAKITFPVSAETILQMARKNGIGRKFGRDVIFSPADIESLDEVCPSSSSVAKSTYWIIRGTLRGIRVEESTGVTNKKAAEEIRAKRERNPRQVSLRWSCHCRHTWRRGTVPRIAILPHFNAWAAGNQFAWSCDTPNVSELAHTIDRFPAESGEIWGTGKLARQKPHDNQYVDARQ